MLLASAPGTPLGFECKVSDFGLATALESTEQTITHENWGTVVYMAPESCAGRCRKASVSGAGCTRARGHAGAEQVAELASGRISFGAAAGNKAKGCALHAACAWQAALARRICNVVLNAVQDEFLLKSAAKQSLFASSLALYRPGHGQDQRAPCFPPVHVCADQASPPPWPPCRPVPQDVYSFGVLLWQMCTGQRPYAGLQAGQVLLGVKTGTLRLQWPPWVNKSLVKVGQACMRFEPKERPGFKGIRSALAKISARLDQKLAALEAAVCSGTVALAPPVSGGQLGQLLEDGEGEAGAEDEEAESWRKGGEGSGDVGGSGVGQAGCVGGVQ